MSSSRKSTQAGFTLIEILVALALITLLAVGISLAFDGSRSRAQALVTNMSELGAANIRLKNDTGCYVSKPAALTDRAKATAANTFCGKNLSAATSTWNGPYVAQFTADTSNQVRLDKVAEGVTVTYGTGAGGAHGATGKQYWVAAAAVPEDIVRQALIECNGIDTANTGVISGAKCAGDPATGAFRILFDETR